MANVIVDPVNWLIKRGDDFLDAALQAYEDQAVADSTKVMEKTPLGVSFEEGGTRGVLRNNWQISPTLNTTYLESANPSKGRAYAQKSYKNTLSKDVTMYLFNNAPYAGIVEYGGYPSPVALGTWLKQSKKYEKRSLNKFSKQAPAGMLRLSFIGFGRRLTSRFRRYKKKAGF